MTADRMDPPARADNATQAEIDRLGRELGQARAALTDANERLARLAEQTDGTRGSLRRQRKAVPARAATIAEERNEPAGTEPAPRSERKASTRSHDKRLRIMLEESTVLADTLRASNEKLRRANREMDERMAERTEQLRGAMAELGRMNAELNRRVEAEIEARVTAQAELFQAQKLEAIGQLTGGIAHDFNNLLTVVISGVQLLGQVCKPDDRCTRILRRTEEAAWRGADLTRQLLTFARRQPLHPDRVDLIRHFEGLRDLLVHSLRGDIVVEAEAVPDLWSAEADLGALELALLNLAVNARDAMPDGGRLTLSAANRFIRQGWDDGLALAPGEYVELTVRDTGTGMEQDVLLRAFEPFFTTKAKGQGTGLGLAQVYGFAKQSGGTAWVQSRVGVGTEVHILLPRSTRPVAAQPAGAATERRVRGRERLSVLVVEDDDGLASAVLEMLGQLGHCGTRVATVSSALAILAGDEQVHLVFSDVLLPGGRSGLDLAREMQRRSVAVPIILTSGYGGHVTEKLAAAKLPFLRKPYRIEALRRAIEEAMGLSATTSD